MNKITRDSLMTLEAYAKARPEFRAKAIAHKKLRSVHIGDHVTLLFEDELTCRYQIQEMLRIEKTFEEQGILDELEAYNPLIPGGRDFRATMMIEYGDEAERRVALTKLKGIERKTWVQVEGAKKVYAIADEDLERENETKTSAVHFMRFPLTEEMAAALKYGVTLQMGVDHPQYTAAVDVNAQTRNALVKDLR
ncbi:MAG: DUF3501 family protein [Rhodocyclaceae bacterium]|nr:DUF3501 family protein [Rhodocyclaceae bacterium]MCE2725093.1 DUF3501 family protein [Betaproteobacteria bacterium]MCA3025139.1 DUF3501 family protein [Rhodocyclaceae bacterium]MCA3033325.1 DUF3501 family protein [Rhodocyclaceae bacterium]MCA3036036.1 DUF3501 family protein [Rhodocyclaceae bacterium]